MPRCEPPTKWARTTDLGQEKAGSPGRTTDDTQIIFVAYSEAEAQGEHLLRQSRFVKTKRFPDPDPEG